MIDQKIAFISDIHGNLQAFEAVVDDIKKAGVDDIVFLGDLADLGPSPNEVIDLLKKINAECLLGNHDDFLFKKESARAYSDEQIILDSIDWTREQLSSNELLFISGFKTLFELSDNEEVRVMAYHGTPVSNAIGIEAQDRPQDMNEYLQADVRTVFIGGHTHHQMLKFAGKHKIANAGSVGMAFAGKGTWGPNLLPFAEYLMVEISGTIVHLSFRQANFDVAQYKKAIGASRTPLKPWLLSQYK